MRCSFSMLNINIYFKCLQCLSYCYPKQQLLPSFLLLVGFVVTGLFGIRDKSIEEKERLKVTPGWWAPNFCRAWIGRTWIGFWSQSSSLIARLWKHVPNLLPVYPQPVKMRGHFTICLPLPEISELVKEIPGESLIGEGLK